MSMPVEEMTNILDKIEQIFYVCFMCFLPAVLRLFSILPFYPPRNIRSSSFLTKDCLANLTWHAAKNPVFSSTVLCFWFSIYFPNVPIFPPYGLKEQILRLESTIENYLLGLFVPHSFRKMNIVPTWCPMISFSQTGCQSTV